MGETPPRQTYSTYGPICPYCDHEHEHDGSFFYDESLTRYECEACATEFDVRVYTMTSWTCTADAGVSTHAD